MQPPHQPADLLFGRSSITGFTYPLSRRVSSSIFVTCSFSPARQVSEVPGAGGGRGTPHQLIKAHRHRLPQVHGLLLVRRSDPHEPMAVAHIVVRQPELLRPNSSATGDEASCFRTNLPPYSRRRSECSSARRPSEVVPTTSSQSQPLQPRPGTPRPPPSPGLPLPPISPRGTPTRTGSPPAGAGSQNSPWRVRPPRCSKGCVARPARPEVLRHHLAARITWAPQPACYPEG